MLDKKTLYKRLDKLTSVLVRMLGDKCVTCGKRLPFNRRQAGHYVPRVVVASRWDLKNVNVQCAKCNVELGGNLDKYAEYMKSHYGENTKATYDFIYSAYKGGVLKELSLDKVVDIYNDYLRAVRELEADGKPLIPKDWKCYTNND